MDGATASTATRFTHPPGIIINRFAPACFVRHLPDFKRIRTRRSSEHLVVLLLAGVAGVQLALNSLSYLLPWTVMVAAWGLACVAVIVATIRIEIYKMKRQRWNGP